LPTEVFIPTIAGAPLTKYGPLPLFVWAHGLEGNVGYFAPYLRSIAEHGYVVAAPTFPLTHAGTPGGSRFGDYVNQPADISFVISQLLASYGPDGTRHRGLLDPERIAVGGHSLGAITTLGLVADRCCIDARVRAAIEIDGALRSFPGGATRERGIPVLFIHGDADTTFPVSESRRMYALSLPPKYLVVLHRMPHTPFRIPSAYAVIDNATLDFLDAYLRHDPTAASELVDATSLPGLATITFAR
jgi:predicted dienelactone hydrolase